MKRERERERESLTVQEIAKLGENIEEWRMDRKEESCSYYEPEKKSFTIIYTGELKNLGITIEVSRYRFYDNYKFIFDKCYPSEDIFKMSAEKEDKEFMSFCLGGYEQESIKGEIGKLYCLARKKYWKQVKKGMEEKEAARIKIINKARDLIKHGDE